MKKTRGLGTLVVAIVIIAVVVALALALTGGGARTVSGPTTLNITKSPVVLRMGGSQYVFKLGSASPASGTAFLYIEEVPVFVNPILNVTLLLHDSTKVNAGTQYANMQIQLDSTGDGSVSVTVTPLQPYLQEQPDYSRIKTISVVLGVAANATTTTTVKATTTTTTAGTTTTINQTAANEARILNYSKNDVYYPLMVNYTVAYANSRNCSAPLYNSSYLTYYSHPPIGTGTYQNVSTIVPYSMSSSVSYASRGDYSVVYSTQSRMPVTSGSALTISVNLSSGTILSSSLSGVFAGLNYSAMEGGLMAAARVGNACGIYVVSGQ